MLQALGYDSVERYHLNEGHASLLTLELLLQRKMENDTWDTETVKKMCVFTTHTPVPAGHDRFPADMIEEHPEVASQPILLTSPTVRRHVFRITHKFIPQLVVLSHGEISTQAKVSSVGVVEVPYAG